jgi:hypothetical protein
MRLGARFVLGAASAGIVLAILLSTSRLSTSRGIAIWVVLVAGLVLGLLIRHYDESSGPAPASRFEQALQRPKPRTAVPDELRRMDDELVLGSADADHAHRQLLPHLRALAAARIAAHHGFELERRPEAARALLGENIWELLRPDRPEPKDRFAPGVPRRQIAAVIERVEAL